MSTTLSRLPFEFFHFVQNWSLRIIGSIGRTSQINSDELKSPGQFLNVMTKHSSPWGSNWLSASLSDPWPDPIIHYKPFS